MDSSLRKLDTPLSCDVRGFGLAWIIRVWLTQQSFALASSPFYSMKSLEGMSKSHLFHLTSLFLSLYLPVFSVDYVNTATLHPSFYEYLEYPASARQEQSL